ncbi:MAG: phosphatidate cytidylyltransferase [Oligoflexales bacterium]|nr:phosphatidate cytidylyltransferase [Oligoflexales bacterium]
MLKHRVLTAVVGLPLVLALLTQAPMDWIQCFFLLLSMLCVWEISRFFMPALVRRLASKKGPSSPFYQGQESLSVLWTLGLCLLNALLLGTFMLARADLGAALSFCFALIFIAGVFVARNNIERGIAISSGLLMSLCYSSIPWLALIEIQEQKTDIHSGYILVLLAIVMGNDTGAYFAGTLFGRRKLAPELSPKKSWEGFFGGLVFGILLALLVARVINLPDTWLMILALSLIGTLAGTLGDLIESALKRFAEIKDSGALFPGHGGMLDRADSILIAAPLFLVVLKLGRTLYP